VAAAVGDTEFCELISAQDTATETMDVFDPASVEKSIKDALDAIRGARDLVPSDIRGEYDTLASAFEGLVEALEESGWDMLAIDVNDPRILRMESPEVLSAADALNDFCGLEAGGTDGESGAQSPDAGAGSDAVSPTTWLHQERCSFVTRLVSRSSRRRPPSTRPFPTTKGYSANHR